MGRVRGTTRALLLAALLSVACRNGFDSSATGGDAPWRLVRPVCDATDCFLAASDPDGASPVRLAGGDSLTVNLTPSPDGKQIAYLKDTTARILIRTLASGADRAIAWSNRPTAVAWSPDGQWLAIEDFDEVTRTSSLQVVHPDGTGRRLLTQGELNPAALSWSPDGKSLLVMRFPRRLDIIDVATGAVARTVDENGDWGIWSPDGKQIAYTRNSESQPAFYLVDRDGSNPRRLVPSDPADPVNTLYVWPSFSPDGRYLVAHRPGSGSGGIFRLTLDGQRVPWSGGVMFLQGGKYFWMRVK